MRKFLITTRSQGKFHEIVNALKELPFEFKKTNAEMTIEEKNEVSHRGKSLKKAVKILKEKFI